MLEKVEATRFDRAMTKGRTMPLLLAAEYSDGRSIELIGKFSDVNLFQERKEGQTQPVL